MKRLILVAILSIVPQAAMSAALDRIEKPGPGWRGAVFRPNFDFPKNPPSGNRRPWEAIDFKTEPRNYLDALLHYVLEGQDRKTWAPSENKVRDWYHAPWLGPGPTGREFISGLTRGRNSKPGELGRRQTRCHQNWSLVLFNPTGGQTLGRIWAGVRAGTGGPDPSPLPFPIGTMITKFQFTDATPADVPQLENAPELMANVHVRRGGAKACPPLTRRKPQRVRLLQIDIAVRDARAQDHTGWVFASYGYDGRSGVQNLEARLTPLGLTWGSDPQLSDEAAVAGEKPRESIVLSDYGLGRWLGRGGRMNGPIDSPRSSCLSCHATAQWPNAASLMPPRASKWEMARCWFRNLRHGEAFGLMPSARAPCGTRPKRGALIPTDYSILVAVGARNWLTALKTKGSSTQTRHKAVGKIDVNGIDSNPISRGGEENPFD